jgi:hypothetical protein
VADLASGTTPARRLTDEHPRRTERQT